MEIFEAFDSHRDGLVGGGADRVRRQDGRPVRGDPGRGRGPAGPGRAAAIDRCVYAEIGAGHADAVRACPASSPRSAVFLTAGMDRAERRRGQGKEDARVVRDRGGDALAAAQSGADELVGVSVVGLGAGRAAGGAADLARDRQDPAGPCAWADQFTPSADALRYKRWSVSLPFQTA
jgi:hypothetical protein